MSDCEVKEIETIYFGIVKELSLKASKLRVYRNVLSSEGVRVVE